MNLNLQYTSSVRRALALLLACAGTIFNAHAQTIPSATFRTLALGKSVNGVYYYDNQGNQVEVMAGSSGFSRHYDVPKDGNVSFYRMVPAEPPDIPERKETLKTVHMSGEGPFLVFMLAQPDKPSEPRMLIVDDSWALHPKRTVKIYNFSRRTTMVNIDANSVELSSGQSHIFDYPEGQLWLKAATKEEDGWKLRVSSPQITLPESRSTLVLIDQLPSIDRPNADALLVRNFLDPKPPESD